MRLLNTTTLELEFFVAKIPRYAILSHRWEDEEVTFHDLGPHGHAIQLKGYSKLENAAHMAHQEGYQYIWIDTCCIDKSSSSELSEAINSMFEWYKNSEHCFAYLSDLTGDVAFHQSQWFTRGWTLQELLAPKDIHFYDKFWEPRGTKQSLKDEIQSITGISPDVLLGAELSTIPACCKMSWAADRVTTRAEDMAYCLVGLLDVNMPLLYGEGAEKAFRRLQEAFVRQSDDESIFAWTADAKDVTESPYWGLLASSPAYFRDSGRYTIPQFRAWQHGGPTEVTNKGIRVSLMLEPVPGDASGTLFLAPLNCSHLDRDQEEIESAFTIILQRMSDVDGQFTRVRPDRIIPIRDAPSATDGESPAPAVMSQLFVRSSTKGTDPVTGFAASRKQTLSFDFHMNSLRTLQGTTYVEFSGLAPWELRGAKSQQRYIAELKKTTSKLDPALFDVGKLQQRRLVGCLELKITTMVEDKKPTTSNNIPQSFSMKPDSIYLLVGFEPLPPNVLGTLPGFVRPWYSFSTSNDDALVEELTRPDSNPQKIHQSPGGCKIMVQFTIVTHRFRTCYDIGLVEASTV